MFYKNYINYKSLLLVRKIINRYFFIQTSYKTLLFPKKVKNNAYFSCQKSFIFYATPVIRSSGEVDRAVKLDEVDYDFETFTSHIVLNFPLQVKYKRTFCTTLLKNFNWWRCYLALCDEIFDHFPLFYETSCHIELCNSVASQMQRNPPKLF